MRQRRQEQHRQVEGVLLFDLLQSIASNKYFDAIADLKLSQPNSLQANPNYGPLSDSPLRGAASFTDPLVANGFDKVTYVGAFADENDGWMSGWTEFDPQNKAY